MVYFQSDLSSVYTNNKPDVIFSYTDGYIHFFYIFIDFESNSAACVLAIASAPHSVYKPGHSY